MRAREGKEKHALLIIINYLAEKESWKEIGA